MKKFYFLSILVLTMVAVMLPQKMVAQSVSVWDGSSAIWTQGSGTEADPYLIETAQNLAWISEMVNNGVTTYNGVWFKLTSNLNMRNIAWVPIGNSTTNCFCGKFDGDNHFIDSVSVTGTYTYAGLFGITGTGADISNIGVHCNVNISGSDSYAGGIIGRVGNNETHITNCHNSGNISADDVSGGIVGYLNGASVENCYNTGNVSSFGSGNSYSGGIVGSVSGNGVVENCHNTGIVSSSCSYGFNDVQGANSGGIVGHSYGLGAVVRNCYNTGNVFSSCSSSTNSSDFISNSGGILGGGCHTITLENCYNTGSIFSSCFCSYSYNGSTTKKSYSSSGGIIGRFVAADNNTSRTATISQCFNNGTITATAYSLKSVARNAYSGGLCGKADAMRYIKIFNSYNRGDVAAYAYYGTDSTASGTRTVGGLVGESYNGTSSIYSNSYNTGVLTGSIRGGIRGNTSGTVSNCYYLETCGGTVSGGTPKTEVAMKSASFPIMLNTESTVFVTDVTPNVNDGYPIFGKSVCEVLTQNATNVGFTSATLNGAYTRQQFWPGGIADVVGFEYKQSSNTSYTTVYANVDSLASCHLSGLQS